MEQYPEALADFNRAIELDDKDASIFADRGLTYQLMKQYLEALTDFNRAIELDDTLDWVIAERGEIHRKNGNYLAALTDFDRVITFDDKVSNTRGLILSYLGRYAEAIENYEQELHRNPDHHAALYNIAVAMARWKGLPKAQTQIETARAKLQSITDTEVHGAALYGLGGLAAVEGNSDQALNYLQEAIPLNGEAVDWARHDIAWLDLRTDPRFQALISGTK
jgi:tetratricopeptide (TPR) repeat protein